MSASATPPASFTPEPWRISSVNRKRRSVTVRAGSADIGIATINSNRNQDANAHLIAAAPEMHAVLTEARNQIEYLHDKFQATGTGNATLARIEAVLAKVRSDHQ